MRIVIVSGIFEPESGGPAVYAPRLAAQLVTMGDIVTVVTYSTFGDIAENSRYPFRLVRVHRGNKILNRVRFFFAVFPHIAKSDCVYLLDWFAAGFPAALAARVCRRPYVVRVGGDYLWEQRYLESGQPPLSLRAFYERSIDRTISYRPYRFLILMVLRSAKFVVFNASRMRDLYVRYYDLKSENTLVIENPVPTIAASLHREQPTKEIVFWGRLIEMKNVASLIRAFAQATLPVDYKLVIIGDGPQRKQLETLARALHIAGRVTFEAAKPHDQVLARVKDARAFVLPSWTDISPNQVYEALALGLPSIVTKENSLDIYERLPVMIDPASVDEIAEQLRMLTDDEVYKRFSEAFQSIALTRSWETVAREHQALFEKVV